MKTIPKLSRTSFKYIITPLSMEKYNLKCMKITICIKPRKAVLSKRNNALKLKIK